MSDQSPDDDCEERLQRRLGRTDPCDRARVADAERDERVLKDAPRVDASDAHGEEGRTRRDLDPCAGIFRVRLEL